MRPAFLKYPRFIYQRVPLFLGCFSFFFLLVLAWAIGYSAANDSADILPVDLISGHVKSSGAPQKAEGKELFELINGGAVIFFKHNFIRALFQEYVVACGQSINLEIYEMASMQDARDIYTAKKGKGGAILGLGQEGLLFDYYCILYQGSYFVSITGSDSTDAVREVLSSMAQQVVANIKNIP